MKPIQIFSLAAALLTTIDVTRGAQAITVSTNAGAEFGSVQAAIDAAEPNAQIRIAPGVYRENLLITKSVNLLGSGWRTTRIEAPGFTEATLEATFRRRFEELEKLSDPAKIQAFIRTWRQDDRYPITITNVDAVRINGIHFRWAGPKSVNPPVIQALIYGRESGIELSDCVVAGSPQNGMIFGNRADVLLKGCLIAGNWGTGAVFGELNARVIRAHLFNCDVRNNYYAGISLGSAESSHVEGCRISGSAWHGLRLGGPDSIIEKNVIFRNARSGIYGGGKTRAMIRGNLFHRNDINGISCWDGNRDVIEGNTFIANGSDGVLHVNDAQPVLRRNIFVGNPVAVRGSWSMNRFKGKVEEPLLDGNLFWQNGTNRFRPFKDPNSTNILFDLKLPEEGRNVFDNPFFENADNHDFALRSDSPARRNGIGAAEPPAMTSLFELLPEELAIIPDTDIRDWNKWKKPPRPDLAWVEARMRAISERMQLATKRPQDVSFHDAFKDLHATLGREYAGFDIKGINWTNIGKELLPRAREVKTDEEFGRLCLELVARLEDSHAYLGKGLLSPPSVEFPRFDPGFACLLDDRAKPVIYHVDENGPASMAGIVPGMTVVSVNGTPADQVVENRMIAVKKYSGYSSTRYLRYQVARWFVRQPKQGAPVKLELADIAGKRRLVDLTADFDVRYLPRLPVPIQGIRDSSNVAWKMSDDDVGYIHVRRIRNDLIDQLDKAVADLRSAKGLIIDVRGNSGGGFDFNRSHLNFMADKSKEPERPRFTGPMAVLIDSRCISAGEGWASWFVANRRAKLFGEATAGASSRKKTYELKNKLYTVTYSIRSYKGYLDRPIERRGLEPDFEVRQSAADLAAGRDTVLERARGYLRDFKPQNPDSR